MATGPGVAHAKRTKQGDASREGETIEKLDTLVHEFVDDLRDSVRAFTGRDFKFSTEVMEPGAVSIRLAQHDEEAGIIPLRLNEHAILGLRIEFRCSWDSTKSFLAVERSSFAVYPRDKANGEPLFRVEYDRRKSSYPSSHIHVHAHRDEMTHLLGLHRKLNPSNDKKVKNFIETYPSLSRFHFPTGGHRFRPCLEDVLEALRQEFKLKVPRKKDWEDRLAEARLKWRKIQTAAAVRDCPDAALRVLVDDLGMPSPVGWECPPGKKSKIVRG
ncbi:hypothetical protein [Corynebacterium sp. UMB4614]|uniref:hypothetical protein n=1 Tax=Corynebacterium sp. UMB4614 TaxID=3046334 RepID=UPI00254CE504|nr:hypothetical protein [Corynebacterium sp. UMB4614]